MAYSISVAVADNETILFVDTSGTAVSELASATVSATVLEADWSLVPQAAKSKTDAPTAIKVRRVTPRK